MWIHLRVKPQIWLFFLNMGLWAGGTGIKSCDLGEVKVSPTEMKCCISNRSKKSCCFQNEIFFLSSLLWKTHAAHNLIMFKTIKQINTFTLSLWQPISPPAALLSNRLYFFAVVLMFERGFSILAQSEVWKQLHFNDSQSAAHIRFLLHQQLVSVSMLSLKAEQSYSSDDYAIVSAATKDIPQGAKDIHLYKKNAQLRFVTFRSGKSWPEHIQCHWLPLQHGAAQNLCSFPVKLQTTTICHWPNTHPADSGWFWADVSFFFFFFLSNFSHCLYIKPCNNSSRLLWLGVELENSCATQRLALNQNRRYF